MRDGITALTLVGVALLGCASDHDGAGLGAVRRYPVPGCEAYDPAPCNVQSGACQRRLFGLAACMRGSDAGDPPAVSIVDEDQYRSYLLAEDAARESEPGLSVQWENALVMLGMAAPGSFSTEAQVDDSVELVFGFYSPVTKSLTLVDHGADSDVETSSSVLFHEFVHALQDRDIDLLAYHDTYERTYDTTFAAGAIVEGEAEFHQNHYLASMLGFDPRQIDWDRLFQNGVDLAGSALAQDASPLTAAWRYFPYRWGARFVHRVWGATGRAGVLGLLAAPPQATLVEMASSAPAADEIVASEVALPEPPPEWVLVDDDVLGALGVFEFLTRRIQPARAQELVLAWRGDRMGLYVGSGTGGAAPSATAVVWTVELADADTATMIARLTASPHVTADGTRVIIAADDAGLPLTWAFATSTD